MMNQLRWIRERVAYWLFVSNVGFVVAVIVRNRESTTTATAIITTM
jgi:hypothetical protein